MDNRIIFVMEEVQEKKHRDSSVDVMKGILIILVIINHITGVALKSGIEFETINVLHICRYLYIPFFMPAFFIITGYCSSFNKSFNELVKNGLKTLILPSVVFSLVFSLKHVESPWGGDKNSSGSHSKRRK